MTKKTNEANNTVVKTPVVKVTNAEIATKLDLLKNAFNTLSLNCHELSDTTINSHIRISKNIEKHITTETDYLAQYINSKNIQLINHILNLEHSIISSLPQNKFYWKTTRLGAAVVLSPLFVVGLTVKLLVKGIRFLLQLVHIL